MFVKRDDSLKLIKKLIVLLYVSLIRQIIQCCLLIKTDNNQRSSLCVIVKLVYSVKYGAEGHWRKICLRRELKSL